MAIGVEVKRVFALWWRQKRPGHREPTSCYIHTDNSNAGHAHKGNIEVSYIQDIYRKTFRKQVTYR